MLRLKNLFKEVHDPYSKTKTPETTREFYLDSTKDYIYIPKDRLEFESGKLRIFENKSRTLKVFYMPKLMLPTVGVGSVAVGSSLINYAGALSFTLLVSLAVGILHSTLGCKILTKIDLHEDGKHVDISYRVFNMFEITAKHPISEFKDQYVSMIMLMWSLHPIPKNILSAIESPVEELMPMYLRHEYGFYLLHGKPTVFRPDIFFNIANGVNINTKAFKPKTYFFKGRYKEITDKSKDTI
jgi:hypothetical protein